MTGDLLRWEVPAAFKGWEMAFTGIIEVRSNEVSIRPKDPDRSETVAVARSGDAIVLVRGRLLSPWMRTHVVLTQGATKGWANISLVHREFESALDRFGFNGTREVRTWIGNGSSLL